MNLQDIDTSYWKYLEGISYHHLQGYLKELDAEDYFAELFPIVRKKLQACAAVRINQKEWAHKKEQKAQVFFGSQFQKLFI